MRLRLINAPDVRALSLTADVDPFGELYSFTVETSINSIEPFYLTSRAVYQETAHPPTHFLVGWLTLAALRSDESLRRYAVWDGVTLKIDNVPVYLDPTRRESIVAVPEFNWLVGREMSAAFSWVPPCVEHEDCRANPKLGEACARAR